MRKFLKRLTRPRFNRYALLGDNSARKYSNSRYGALEDVVREAIRKARDEWRAPFRDEEVYDERWLEPGYVPRYERILLSPDDKLSIREALAMDDSKFRGTPVARRLQYIRVPSMKRSEREWVNFYRTFPLLAADVAIGEERFCDGARLRYVNLFKRILDEEWPEDLKMWTVEQYEDLIRRGLVPTSSWKR